LPISPLPRAGAPRLTSDRTRRDSRLTLDRRPQAGEIDDDALLAAARDHHHGWVAGRVFLAVWCPRRHEDIVARRRGQAHLIVPVREDEDRVAGQHVDRGLGVAVVVVAGVGVRAYVGLAHPDLRRPDRGAGDGLTARHAAGLAGVAGQL